MTSRHSVPARRRLVAAVGTLALAAALAGVASQASASAPPAEIDRTDWPDTLTFGAVPSEEATALEASYANIIAVLEEDLGVDIEVFQATDYAGIIEGMIAGNVDIAAFGPFSYVLAVQNGAQIQPLGAAVDAPDATPGYTSYGLTRGDNSEINSIEDFAGHTVCFVDPGSTSGYLYPSAGLIDAGVDPTNDITPVFAGGHDASVLSIADGTCEAGFAFDAMTQSLIDAGDIADGDIKQVWESEVIAGSPHAIRTELPPSLVDEVSRIYLEGLNVDAFIERGLCTDAESCEVTDEAGTWGFVSVDDSFYDGVRAVCEATQAEACNV